MRDAEYVVELMKELKAILKGLKDVPETQSVKSNSKSKKNRFNSFSQRDNDYGELESLLLNSTI